MADLAQPSINAGARSFLARWDRRFHSLQSRVARYGLAIVSVTVALGLSLALQYYQFRGVEVPVLTLAIAVTTWYAGNGPAVVAIILSSLCFDYFFTEPYYSFEITRRDLPYFFIFVIWGLIVAAFSAVRRHVEEGLRQAQEELAKRAVELHAINSMLTHEINQPLQAIVANAHAALRWLSNERPNFDEARAALKAIVSAGHRAGEIARSLHSTFKKESQRDL